MRSNCGAQVCDFLQVKHRGLKALIIKTALGGNCNSIDKGSTDNTLIMLETIAIVVILVATVVQGLQGDATKCSDV